MAERRTSNPADLQDSPQSVIDALLSDFKQKEGQEQLTEWLCGQPWYQQRFRQRLIELLRQRGIEADVDLKFSGTSVTARVIQPSLGVQTDNRRMIEEEYGSKLGRILAQRSFIKGGIPYFPLSFAAPLAQVPETTLRDWIKKKTKIGGRAIHTHTSPANGIYISEESVTRIANRFIKWPSQEPAGAVTIGETDDQTGYIGLTDAAQTLRIERHTLWRWATKGTAPTEKPLHIIKCPASEQFYISEKDVTHLADLVPRSGLQRGPRPQPHPSPE